MVELMKKRLGTDKNPEILKELGLDLQQANCESLHFKDEEFDCFIGNLVIHCTLNGEKMIQEAHRVLQKGGYLAISAIGPSKNPNSSLNTIISDVLDENQIPWSMPTTAKIDYDNRESVIKTFEDAGFEKIICWKMIVPFPITTQEDFEFLFKFRKVRESIAKHQPERVEEIIKVMIERLSHELYVNKNPLTVESTLLVGQKK